MKFHRSLVQNFTPHPVYIRREDGRLLLAHVDPARQTEVSSAGDEA